MSYKIMTADEFNQALREIGFADKRERKHGQDMGYAAFGRFLGSERGGDRMARYGRGITPVPGEIAMLLRLMIKHGESI